jgi:hypothetical protein
MTDFEVHVSLSRDFLYFIDVLGFGLAVFVLPVWVLGFLRHSWDGLRAGAWKKAKRIKWDPVKGLSEE